MGAEGLGGDKTEFTQSTSVVINYTPPLRLAQELALSMHFNDTDDSRVIRTTLSAYLLTRTDIIGGAALDIECLDLPNKDDVLNSMVGLLTGPLVPEDTTDAVESMKINVTPEYAEKLELEAGLLADGDVSALVTASARFMQQVETVRMLEGRVWAIRDTENESERWVNVGTLYG